MLIQANHDSEYKMKEECTHCECPTCCVCGRKTQNHSQENHRNEQNRKSVTPMTSDTQNHSQQELSDKTSNSSAEDGDRASDTSTLSDKISTWDHRWGKKPYSHILVKDVKDFIQRLDNNLHYFETKERENLHVRAFCKAFRITIKKRAGDKLTK